MDPAIQTPLPPPNQNTQLSEIRTSNQNLNAQRNVVALGPLRWNIVKLCQSWDTAINNLVAQNDSSHTELIKKHKKQSHSHNNSKKHQWEQQKSKVPLHKRLAQMRMSYDNLKHASQHSRAASLKRRMDPMIDSFYKKELSSHITKARSATKKMTERQQKEEAELVVGNQLQLQNLMKEKDKEVKFLRRKNDRSSDDPFAIHYAAVNGELSRLDVLLARPKILNNIDLRDSDSGWTALHFASRSGHVKFAQRLLECKANVNALGPNNETCLHLAAGWGTKEMVGLLLQVGADKTMIDAKGHTALDLARQSLREEIAHLLERWLPVGLTYDQQQALSAIPSDYHGGIEEDPQIRSQNRALEMKISLSGRNHVGLVHTYNKLAKFYRASEPPRFEEAIDSLKCAVKILKVEANANANASNSEVKVAEALNNLGELCHVAGNFNDAKNYLLLAYQMSKTAFGETSNSLILPTRNYALILLETKEFDKAIELLLNYEKMMHAICFSKELMSCTMDMVEVWDLLSYAYMLNKNFDTAKDYMLRANDIIFFHHKGEEGEFEENAWRLDKLALLHFCNGETLEAENTWLKAKDLILKFRDGDEFHEDVMKMTKNYAVAVASKNPNF